MKAGGYGSLLSQGRLVEGERVLTTALQSSARSVLAMAMSVELPALERTDVTANSAPAGRLRRWARPALGLLLPVGLALAWEIIVWLGLSNGRLVPAPSKLFATIVEVGRSGAREPAF